MPSYKLMYFNAKGAAEGLRLMFALKGVEYEDIRYEREEWPNQKDNMPQGMMPVLQIGEQKFCQSGALSRYVARELDLYGSDTIEALKIDEIADSLVDMTKEGSAVFFEQDKEKRVEVAKKMVEKTFPKFINFLCNRIKENGSGFMVGKQVSLADILVYRTFDGIKDFLVSEVLPDYDPFSGAPELKAHFEKIESIPEISAWIEKRPKTKM